MLGKNKDLLIWRQYLELKCVKIMQPRIGSDQSLNIFYQTLTLEYRSTEPCSCYNKAIDEICRRLELHRKRGILSIVALITFINGIIKACSFTCSSSIFALFLCCAVPSEPQNTTNLSKRYTVTILTIIVIPKTI